MLEINVKILPEMQQDRNLILKREKNQPTFYDLKVQEKSCLLIFIKIIVYFFVSRVGNITLI